MRFNVRAVAVVVAVSTLNLLGGAKDDVQLRKLEFLNSVREQSRKQIEEQRNKETEEILKNYNAELERLLAEERKQESERILSENERALQEAIDSQKYAAKEYVEQAKAAYEKAQKELEEARIASLYSKSSVWNDGYAKSLSDIYTKCGISSCYIDDYGNDVDFYDVQIPYRLSCSDVGGVAIDSESEVARYNVNSTLKVGSLRICDYKVGSRIIREWDSPRSPLNERYRLSTDSITGLDVYNAGDTQMYGIALAEGMFPEAFDSKGFYGWTHMNKTGVLADIILTDKTVIHCAVIDGIGTMHTNGVGIYNGWTASSVQTGQDRTRYKLSSVNLPQYSHFFHAASCQVVELSGNSKDFSKAYGLKVDGSGNGIAYIRIYKASLKDGGFNVKEEFKSISTRVE